VDFVLGSGNHSRTYLHLTGRQTLQQLPLGWYAEKGGYWAMNPGYDRPDYPGSARPITYECMFCHNGYPAIPEGHDETGAKPEFLLPRRARIGARQRDCGAHDHRVGRIDNGPHQRTGHGLAKQANATEHQRNEQAKFASESHRPLPLICWPEKRTPCVTSAPTVTLVA
jgi:hypothetical protein